MPHCLDTHDGDWPIRTRAKPQPIGRYTPTPSYEELRDEIARLRLTDEEREAVRFCVQASLPETEKLGGVAAELCRMHAATLRGLLDRLQQDGSGQTTGHKPLQETL